MQAIEEIVNRAFEDHSSISDGLDKLNEMAQAAGENTSLVHEVQDAVTILTRLKETLVDT